MDVIVVKYLNIRSIHVSSADIGGAVPLAEEHVTSVRMNHNGSRSLQVLQESPPVLVILSGENVESSLSGVDIIQVLAGPVKCQTLNSLVLTCEDIFSLSSISFHLKQRLFSFRRKVCETVNNLVYYIQNNIAVINLVFMRVKVKADKSCRSKKNKYFVK